MTIQVLCALHNMILHYEGHQTWFPEALEDPLDDSTAETAAAVEVVHDGVMGTNEFMFQKYCHQ